MTIEEEIRNRLEAMGLCFDRLDACMTYVKAQPDMAGVVWDMPPDPANRGLVLVLWSSIRELAIEWLVQQVGQPTKGE